MKIVVVKTPKLLTGIFRLVFKVKRAEPESDSWTEMNIGKKHWEQLKKYREIARLALLQEKASKNSKIKGMNEHEKWEKPAFFQKLGNAV